MWESCRFSTHGCFWNWEQSIVLKLLITYWWTEDVMSTAVSARFFHHVQLTSIWWHSGSALWAGMHCWSDSKLAESDRIVMYNPRLQKLFQTVLVTTEMNMLQCKDFIYIVFSFKSKRNNCRRNSCGCRIKKLSPFHFLESDIKMLMVH